MKRIEYYFIRPLLIILVVGLLFSFIEGTIDSSKWSISSRICHVVLLLILFVENNNRYDKIKQQQKPTNESNISVIPLTSEQIKKLNEQQKDKRFHPYTCCGYNVDDCKRNLAYSQRHAGEAVDYSSENEGVLIATENYWICPCGKYKQQYLELKIY